MTYQNNEYTFHQNNDKIPNYLIQMIISQSNN